LPAFLIGADLSRVQEQERGGTTFRDLDGTKPSGTTSTGGGVLTLLKAHGFNYVRLRSFVDPKASGGYAEGLAEAFCDRDHTAEFATGVKRAGMGLLLDIHYADNFADPGRQPKPAAWAKLGFVELTKAVHDYTFDLLSTLSRAGGRPDIVQVGNEITQGLLFDASGVTAGTGGKVSGAAFGNLATLLKAGIEAVHEVDPQILVMLHIDRCADAATSKWWLSGVQAAGVQFDIFGQSCYDFAGYQQPSSAWAPTFAELATAFPGLRFAAAEHQPKPLLVAQTIAGIAGKRGLGMFDFEPTSYGDMNSLLFTFSQNVASAEPAIRDYDTIASTYGMR
jgi:arabinogalactan endo-1,4-beta-galactosidase